MIILVVGLIFSFSLQQIHCDNDELLNLEQVFGSSPRNFLNFTELCKLDGYNCESHDVETDDGYILGLFRVHPKDGCSTNEKLPVIFMHGLYLTGDDCLIPGPGKAHCYIYSDNCLDIWVPNVRGNRYSRRHKTLDPDVDSSFWDYALEEHSLYDLPASLDYILQQTGKEKVNYVGHAQGITMLLVLCQKKPEYNDKIGIAYGISPTAWLDHSRFVVVDIEAILAPVLTTSNELNINTEILKYGSITTAVASTFCGLTTLSYPLCSIFYFAILGYNKFEITDDVLPVVVTHIPGGTSLKNFNRWGQIKSNGYTEYDYGIVENLVKYGQVSPPEIGLGNVTVNIMLLCSLNDYVADVQDVAKLNSSLSHGQMCVLSDETFGHLDYIYGQNIPNYITPITLKGFLDDEIVCLK